MTFEVAAEAYDRFMGRYSVQLAPQLADFAGVCAGQRVLDVGCGPGALTSELVQRVGGEAVTAVDPSAPFVAAAKARHSTVKVLRASAERLPLDDSVFDAALAQLVVHFMADPVAGLREMARVTRHGGVVAVCVWDHAGDRTPLAAFWQGARELDPGAQDESELAGAREGHLGELLAEAGLKSVQETTLEASVEFSSFEEWWEPFTLGVGPAGAYAKTLDDPACTRLRDRCRQLVALPPFTVNTTAWTARGLVCGPGRSLTAPKDAYAESFLTGACPIVGSYGAKDRTLRGAADRLERTLTAAGVDHDVKEYPEAGHAFLNDHDSVRVLFAVMAKLSPGDSYHEPSAHDPRRRILSFFNTHLRA